MTQEEKELLLKDLSSRLRYQPFCKKVDVEDDFCECDATLGYSLRDLIDNKIIIKPYLRPMSSMTEEEREEFWKEVLDIDWRELEFDEEPDEVPFPFTENDCGFYLDNIYLADLFAVIDWLNEHHFDYRGLIPKGLAIEVTKDNNPYKEIVL